MKQLKPPYGYYDVDYIGITISINQDSNLAHVEDILEAFGVPSHRMYKILSCLKCSSRFDCYVQYGWMASQGGILKWLLNLSGADITVFKIRGRHTYQQLIDKFKKDFTVSELEHFIKMTISRRGEGPLINRELYHAKRCEFIEARDTLFPSIWESRIWECCISEGSRISV